MTAGSEEQSVVLAVDRLEVVIERGGGIRPVRGVSFSVPRKHRLGIIGESGSGKTLTGLAIMRLLPRGVQITAGSITLGSVDLATLTEQEMCKVRGRRISMVYQDPMSALNPLRTVGNQLVEAIRTHLPMNRAAAIDRSLHLLEEVGIVDPRRRLGMYPHEFSGGMLQRVVIAMAMSCSPDILIADEPTSALDVTTQLRVMDRLARMTADHGTTVLMITHDLALATAFCDDIQVMYGGRIVELAPAKQLYGTPIHPYSEALVNSICTLTADIDLPLQAIRGQPATPSEMPSGCAFHPRCPVAIPKCSVDVPGLKRVSQLDRLAACHLAESRVARLLPK